MQGRKKHSPLFFFSPLAACLPKEKHFMGCSSVCPCLFVPPAPGSFGLRAVPAPRVRGAQGRKQPSFGLSVCCHGTGNHRAPRFCSVLQGAFFIPREHRAWWRAALITASHPR